MEKLPDPPRDVFDEAADWWQRVRDGSSEDLAACEIWLGESPEHRKAFDSVKASWAAFSNIASEPQVLERRAITISQARAQQRRRVDRAAPTRRALVGVAAAAAVAVVAVPGYLIYKRSDSRLISTGRGQSQQLTLSDGSRLTIDANTELQVNFDLGTRRIEVRKGRAHFAVAKDASRPFRVQAADKSVTAIGTEFTVELRKQIVSVALFEGKVAIATASKNSHDIPLAELKPGQSVRFYPGENTSPKFSQVDEQQDLSWQRHQLYFSDEALEDVAERINDYSATPVTVDGNARKILVSGVFIVGQTDSFVNGLAKFYDIKVEKTEDRILITSRRS